MLGRVMLETALKAVLSPTVWKSTVELAGEIQRYREKARGTRVTPVPKVLIEDVGNCLIELEKQGHAVSRNMPEGHIVWKSTGHHGGLPEELSGYSAHMPGHGTMPLPPQKRTCPNR